MNSLLKRMHESLSVGMVFYDRRLSGAHQAIRLVRKANGTYDAANSREVLACDGLMVMDEMGSVYEVERYMTPEEKEQEKQRRERERSLIRQKMKEKRAQDRKLKEAFAKQYKKNFKEVEISDLTRVVLGKNNIYAYYDLRHLSEGELMRLPGIGRKAIGEIKKIHQFHNRPDYFAIHRKLYI